MAAPQKQDLLGLFSRFVDNLAHNLQQTRTDDYELRPIGQRLTFLDLPPEIHRQILTWLPAGQQLLLSLTCKGSWARRDVAGSDWLQKCE